MKLLLALLVAVPASARPPGHGAPEPFTLEVTADPGGSVAVGRDAPDGSLFVCHGGKNCQMSLPRGSKVHLKWSPDSGTGVNSWSGACRQAGEVCVLTMNSPRSVGASPAKAATLVLSLMQGGRVHIDSPWAARDAWWGSPYSFDFPEGSSVTLTLKPDPLFVAKPWSGPCQGAADAPCSLTVSGTVYVSVWFDDVGATLTANPFTGRIEAWRQSDKDAGTMTEANKVLDCSFPPGPKCTARLEKGMALWARRTLPTGAAEGDWWWTDACTGSQHAAECRFTAANTRTQVGLQQGKAVVITPPKGGAVKVYVAEFTTEWRQTCSDGGPVSSCVILWTDGIPMQVGLSVERREGMTARWTGAPNCTEMSGCRFDALPATANVSVEYVKKP